MRPGMFGWDLPPGCTHADIERATGMDQPCEMCGKMVDDCICPECPVCYGVGDPLCYQENKHGLIYTKEQMDSLTEAQKQWEAEAKAEAEDWRQYDEEQEQGGTDGYE